MAHVALIVVAVDGLWRRPDRVPEADRLELLTAAGHGLHIALWTRADDTALHEVHRRLRMETITIVGDDLCTEVRGRLVSAEGTMLATLAALALDLSRSPFVFRRDHILGFGTDPADLPLLEAAGIGVWVPSEQTEVDEAALRHAADYVATREDSPVSGVAEAVRVIALRNNRYLSLGLRRPALRAGFERWDGQ